MVDAKLVVRRLARRARDKVLADAFQALFVELPKVVRLEIGDVEASRQAQLPRETKE